MAENGAFFEGPQIAISPCAELKSPEQAIHLWNFMSLGPGWRQPPKDPPIGRVPPFSQTCKRSSYRSTPPGPGPLSYLYVRPFLKNGRWNNRNEFDSCYLVISLTLGSKCTVTDEFLKKIAKTEVVTQIFTPIRDQILKKSDGSKRSRMSNPKLTDQQGWHERWAFVYLILTEGDSAKGLAMAGWSVVGPDLFVSFP